MSSSELSELTSNVSSGEENIVAPLNKGKLDHYFKNASNVTQAPPTLKKKRPPSPPHEYVLADNADISFICMFRSRFSDAFPKSLPHFGPQDVENGVTGSPPGEQVEKLLCALLSLVLNRKKDIEKGHYTRGLEEAIHAHASQWPAAWQGGNPLHGGGSFDNMTPEQRLTLMKTLIFWSLESSEAIKNIIKESYKQHRHEDDLNQPLSVQAWGRDGDKRRFWLIEGRDDTHFRLYRESNPALKHVTWRSVAGSIDEVRSVAEKLGEDNSQASRRLRERIMNAIPRFEESEEKRRKRDYRLARRAQFSRPEPGFSLYEGRTRGKRIRYTYSDEEGGSDSARRSNRQSGISTPAEVAGPTYTASGRQIRSRLGGAYGETRLSGDKDELGSGELSGTMLHDGDQVENGGRGRPRGGRANGVKRRPRASHDIGSSEESGAESGETSSGHEWDGGDDDDADDGGADDEDDNADLEMSGEEADDDDDEMDHIQKSLVVRLRYGKSQSASPSSKERLNGLSTDPGNTGPSPLGKSPSLEDLDIKAQLRDNTISDKKQQARDVEMADVMPAAARYLLSKDNPIAGTNAGESNDQSHAEKHPTFAPAYEATLSDARPAQPVASPS